MKLRLALALTLAFSWASGCRTRPLGEEGLLTDGGARDLPFVDLPLPIDGPFIFDMPRTDLPSPFCDEVDGPRGNAPLRCNAQDCPSGNVCCVNETTTLLQLCQSGCQSGFNTFTCDDPQDCTGGVCCFNNQGPPPRKTSCTAPGQCTGLAVCHKTSDCPAGSGTLCRRMSGFPDGAGACLPPC